MKFVVVISVYTFMLAVVFFAQTASAQQGRSALGGQCTTTADCAAGNLTCDNQQKTCACRSGYHVASNNCYVSRNLNDQCGIDEECANITGTAYCTDSSTSESPSSTQGSSSSSSGSRGSSSGSQMGKKMCMCKYEAGEKEGTCKSGAGALWASTTYLVILVASVKALGSKQFMS